MYILFAKIYIRSEKYKRKMHFSECKMQLESGLFTKRTQEKEKKPDVDYSVTLRQIAARG